MKKKQCEALLSGVEVKFYQGMDGTWHSSVLLDPKQYPDRGQLPRRGNRPLVDESSRRWWYDLSQALYEYAYNSNPRRLVHYTPNEARALLDRKVAALLAEIATFNLTDEMQKVVAKAEHRSHWKWSQRQETRRQDHLAGGLPTYRRREVAR